MLGKSEGGPGVWTKVGNPPKGQAYQEQISKVERGIEYKVKGVKFDGYDPKRKVLVDAKDWEGWPRTDNEKLLEQFRKKTLEQAGRQTKAVLGTGAKIEWHVSTKEKAQLVEKVLKRGQVKDIAVVYIPKL